MMGWAEMACAMAAFLLSHAIPVQPKIRGSLVQRLGQRTYLIGFSIVSAALLVWLIGAAGRAPYVAVLPPWAAWRWCAVIAMLPACVLIVVGVRVQNPLSFGGMGQGPFDATAPGVLALTRHPLLVALVLWSMGHGLANADLAHVILFGLFAGFAVLGMVMIDRRKRASVSNWDSLARNTALFDLSGWRPDVGTLAVSVVLYGLLIALHPLVIGVPVLL